MIIPFAWINGYGLLALSAINWLLLMLELILIDLVFLDSPVIEGINKLTVHESSRLLPDKSKEAKKRPE